MLVSIRPVARLWPSLVALTPLVAACSGGAPTPAPGADDAGTDAVVTPEDTAPCTAAGTFQPLLAPAEAATLALHETSDALYAVTRYGVYRRARAATAWTREEVEGFETPVFSAASAASADALYVATGKVVRRRDAKGWTDLGGPAGATWFRGLAAAGDVVVALTGGRLFRRIDGRWVAESTPGTMGVSDAVATDGRVVLVGSGYGSILRHDGAAWSEIPTRELAVALSIGFVGDRVFVADSSGSVFRSGDQGATYAKVGRLPFLTATRFFALGAAVVAASPSGAAISKDDGATWTTLTTPEEQGHVALAVVGGELLVSGAALRASSDLGATFRAQPSFVASTPHALSTVGDRVYAATLDGATSVSSAGAPFERLGSARNLSHVVETPSGRLLATGSKVAPDSVPNFLTGQLASSVDGTRWTEVAPPFYSNAVVVVRAADRILLGAAGHLTTGSKAGGVAPGGAGVWSSANGVSWTAANSGVPGDATGSYYADVLALVSTDRGALASFAGAGLYATLDARTWKKSPGGPVDATAVAARGAQVLAASATTWARSDDGGVTFTTFTPTGLPAGAVSSLLALDGVFVAAIGTTVYASRDGGAHWSTLGVLPGKVWSLAASGTTLYVGTAGAGLFTRDTTCLP